MSLEYLLDASVYGKKVTSTIDCSVADSNIVYTEGPPGTEKQIAATKPLYNYPLIANATMLRGYCKDVSCTQIVKGCKLIYPMTYYKHF